MFRRTGNPPFEDPTNLYDEEAKQHSHLTPYVSRNEHLELSAQIFTTPKVETRVLSTPPPLKPQPPHFDEGSSSVEVDILSSFSETPETTLGEGVFFKGELTFERLLRIDGIFEGVLVSSGKIIIGPRGQVRADIKLQEAIIEGFVEGNICVTGKVELRGGAVVKGNITAKTLCIDEGVKLCGFVSVPTNADLDDPHV